MALRVSFENLRGARGAPTRYRDRIADERPHRPAIRRGLGGRSAASPCGRRDLESLLKSARGGDDSYAGPEALAYYAGFERACAGEGMVFSSSVVLDEMKKRDDRGLCASPCRPKP